MAAVARTAAASSNTPGCSDVALVAAAHAAEAVEETDQALRSLADAQEDVDRRKANAAPRTQTPAAVVCAQAAAWVPLPVRRSDPSDGRLRTFEEFVAQYGDAASDRWEAVWAFRKERRCAPDGLLYDEDAFRSWWGVAQGSREWRRAGAQRSRGAAPSFNTTTTDAYRPCAYLLVDGGGKNYIGSTTGLQRRVRQHNGKLHGGAQRTAQTAHPPWSVGLVVTGFKSYADAHAFESDWHKPSGAFALTPMQRSEPRRPLHLRRLPENVHLLEQLLGGWATTHDVQLDVARGDDVNDELHLGQVRHRVAPLRAGGDGGCDPGGPQALQPGCSSYPRLRRQADEPLQAGVHVRRCKAT